MNHLPRFLVPNKERRRVDVKNPRKPKLERRNAVKNFDYDASSLSPSSCDNSSSSRLITRSLDLDRTSFRVEGSEGEFDRICRSLGIEADDFMIPADKWEAWKLRSASDLLPRSRLNLLDSSKIEGVELKESEVGVRVSDNVSEVVAAIGKRIGDTVKVRNAIELIRNEPAQLNACGISGGDGGIKGVRVLDNQSEVVAEIGNRIGDTVRIGDVTELIRNEPAQLNACLIRRGGGGIKGVRPPVLRPPPAMKLPVIDNSSSTWDIFRDFAPHEDGGNSLIVHVVAASLSDEDEEVDVAVIREEEEEEMMVRPRENTLLSESCSFTTSNDDDSSSSTTDPLWISPDGKYKRNITYWERGELLGRGSFGSVYEGISDDGFFFAVKEVSLLDHGSQGKQSVVQLEQEIALLSQFAHENIVQYYGTDKDESKLYIFLELVTKGSLQSLYMKYNLRDSQVSSYTRQILHGLKYLHDRNVIHRDIKCANILVDASGFVKVADFGLAKATKLNDVKSCKGTAFWMAPEVVKSKKDQGYGLPADIWSLGCTVLEMLTREIPYSHLECQMQALYRIGNGELPLVPDTLSRDAQAFILQCLQVEPNDRPTAAQLLDHPFVKRPLTSSYGSASPYLGRRY